MEKLASLYSLTEVIKGERLYRVAQSGNGLCVRVVVPRPK